MPSDKRYYLLIKAVAITALFMLAACASGTSPTAPPTQLLTPPPPTATAVPPTATASAPALPAPQELRPSPTRPNDTAMTPLQTRVVEDLAFYLSISPDLIQVLEAAPVIWPNPQLACEVPPNLVQAVAGYRFRLLVGNRIYEYHTDRTEQIRRCPTTDVLRGEQLVAMDPVAAEMVALAQRQVAQELDLPTRRAQLVDVYAVTWPDSSLGCPLPDQTYDPIHIDGYRIVIIAGETEYAFHTDSVMLVLCPRGREVLPTTPSN